MANSIAKIECISKWKTQASRPTIMVGRLFHNLRESREQRLECRFDYIRVFKTDEFFAKYSLAVVSFRVGDNSSRTSFVAAQNAVS